MHKFTCQPGPLGSIFNIDNYRGPFSTGQIKIRQKFLQNYAILFFPKVMIDLYEKIYETGIKELETKNEKNIQAKRYNLDYMQSQIANLKRSYQLNLLPIKKHILQSLIESALPGVKFPDEYLEIMSDIANSYTYENGEKIIDSLINIKHDNEVDYLLRLVANFEDVLSKNFYEFDKKIKEKFSIKLGARNTMFKMLFFNNFVENVLNESFYDPTLFDILIRVKDGVYPGVTLENITDDFIENECKTRVLKMSYFGLLYSYLVLPYEDFVAPLEEIYQICKENALLELKQHEYSIDRYFSSHLYHRSIIYGIRMKKETIKKLLRIILCNTEEMYKNVMQNFQKAKKYLFSKHNNYHHMNYYSYRTFIEVPNIEDLYKEYYEKRDKKSLINLLTELIAYIRALDENSLSYISKIKESLETLLLENNIDEIVNTKKFEYLVKMFYISGGRPKNLNSIQAFYGYYHKEIRQTNLLLS